MSVRERESIYVFIYFCQRPPLVSEGNGLLSHRKQKPELVVPRPCFGFCSCFIYFYDI